MSISTPNGTGRFWEAVKRLEIRLLKGAIKRSGGVETEAALELGVSREFLRARKKAYKLD